MATANGSAQLDYQHTTAGTSTDGPVTAATIRDRWDRSQKAAAKEREAFLTNSAFVGNEQWVGWNDLTHVLEQLPTDGDRIMRTENRIWPSLRTLTAKLLKRPLVFEVAPTSADDASQDGARTASAVVADVHHRHDWERLRHNNALLALKGGISVLCTEWDAKAGVPLGTTEDGKHFGTGDTVESVLAVTEIATEPGCRDIERAAWWIKAATLPPADVKAMFKLDAEPPADASAGMSPLQRKLFAAGVGGTSSSEPKLTLVLTYYERPGIDGKGGQVIKVVDNRIVEGPKPWPFSFKERLNCVAVRETPHDQDWLADTIVSAAIGPQVSLNHAVSKIDEHMKLAADARLAVPESAGDEWDDLSDAPEVVRYFGDHPPTWVSPPAMPGWWENAPERARKAIDDILGVHDISRGEAPSGVNAGIALSLLAEQDDTAVGLFAKEMAEAWGRLASLVLEIYAEKVTEQRQALVTRQGSAPERVTWSGKDLQGQTTAVVPLNAVAPRSDAAQMELAFRLKAVFPEMDQNTFLKIAAHPDANDWQSAIDSDVAKAERENGEMVATSEPLMPAPFDDHAVHIRVHNDFRKTSKYEALDDLTRNVVDSHVQGHEVDAAREAGMQLAKAQANPALAAAPQANEPPMAGDPNALAEMQQAQASGMAQGAPQMPGVPAPPGMSGEGADGQANAAPTGGQ